MVAKQMVIENEYFDEYKKDEDVSISRSRSMQYIIEKIKEENKGLNVIKGKRKDSADILISNEDKILKANFFHSKTYKIYYPSGWHVVEANQIEAGAADLYIFNLKYYSKIYTFIFTSDEMKEYVRNKKKDNNGNYHFNFEVKGGKFLETRDYIEEVKKYMDTRKTIINLLKK